MEEISKSAKAGSPISPVTTPGNEKDFGRSKNDSLTSVDIQEMERVRLSLQSMLKSSEHFLQADKTSPKSTHTPPDKMRFSSRDEDMFPTITTANLMSNYLNTDTKEVRVSGDSTKFSEDADAAKRSNKNYDKSLLLENTLLNETLQKERSKRKHCEKQIKVLQSKLLETQQELAVAVSADRKKDVMINQLDKTLAHVVEDWKKHEEEKFDTISKLEVQHDNDAKFQQRQQEILAQFEKDLSLAAEALSQEQERAANVEREKDARITASLQERDEILHLLEEEKAKNANLDRDFECLEEDVQKAQESQKLIEQERRNWQEEKSQLESQIELITKAHTEDLEHERTLVEQEKQVAEDSQRVLSAVQKEVQQLTAQLDTCFREKENLKTEITLLTAKFEAQRTRQDSEHRAELERQTSKSLRDAQSQLSKSENEIKIGHKKQIDELTKKYKRDLEEQLNNFHRQLKESDKKLQETNEEYEERLAKSHKDLMSVSTERETLRNEKHKLITRLQKMMQSHCAEAMSLLTATTENSTVGIVGAFNEHDSTWMLRQTPTLVTSAANIGPLRESTRTFPSYVTPDSHGHAIRSSLVSNRGQQQQQPMQHPPHAAHVAKMESDESVHNWVRLPTMPADTTTHISYPNTSYISHEPIVNDVNRTLQESDIHTRQRNKHAERYQSHDPDIEEEEISPTTTNESLLEQSPDDLESTKPQSTVNLSADVLKMLQQQQSRQTELNHYVRQLLKQSPSNTSNEEFTDIAAVTSDDGNENSKPDGLPAGKQDMLSSESTYSDLGDMKQMAFTKSAATPGKRFSKIPIAQTPPNKDRPPGKSPGKSTLTPEQVGQLTRLLQMYQKDNMDSELPSPQKMFQYLREVQIRGDVERIEASKTKDHGKPINKESFLEEAINIAEPGRKQSKAKRKLEVNTQQGKIMDVPIQRYEPTNDGSVSRINFPQDETRRPVGHLGCHMPCYSSSVLFHCFRYF
ncbi:centrobin-like isoform X2 [Dendronephthya gigantea]|uniref:centrobin-like isoform X2 n=1 Tax=Dendronephthya gigantea TaxID=151771 RepID=UPI0010695D67|nr:centrobin-like isoform X2 [Dendronephthya gigantea]